MNDRYLYRAKRTDNGEWVEGFYCKRKTGRYDNIGFHEEYEDCIIAEFSDGGITWCDVDPSTICQCTGLKDKNGKLIWENDIVEAWSEGKRAIGNIKQRVDGTWIMYPAWQHETMWYLLPNDDGSTTVEVIGNIFDNPELLEVGEC